MLFRSMVDYWRQELIMQDEVVCRMDGNRFIIIEEAWARHLADAPHDHIVKEALNFQKNLG